LEVEDKNNLEIELPVDALIKKNIVTISSEEGVKYFSSRGYGVIEHAKLVLTFFEALFLIGKKAIRVTDEKTGKKLLFQNILKRSQLADEDAWNRYLIYRDLRSRGYVAREGFSFGIDFRLYDRGDYGKGTAKHLVFGIQEGQPVSVEVLARIQGYVQNLKKNLVIAVINRRGEIVYYSLSELNLR
jgi:tRNA-intron endonuclease